MMKPTDSFAWPLAKLNKAMEGIARHIGLSSRAVELPAPPDDLSLDNDEAFSRWMTMAAVCLGLESEPVQVSYMDVESLIQSSAPALLSLPGTAEPTFLVLLSCERRASLLKPDMTVAHVRPEVVRAALCSFRESLFDDKVRQIVEAAGISKRRHDRARAAILRHQFPPNSFFGGWSFRLAPGVSIWRQVREAHLPQRLVGLVGLHIVQYVLWIISWWFIGRGALQGRLDRGWLMAWAILVLTLIPFRLLETWCQSVFTIRAGALLKQRLLYGALRMTPEKIKHQGAGQLLGRVIESDAVESFSLSGGWLGLTAGLELLLAMGILAQSAGGYLHVLLLLVWIGLTCSIGIWHVRHRRLWTEARLEMTHDLVERMVGHRTRLVQEPRGRWHDEEDHVIDNSLQMAAVMDQNAALLMALVPRGWLVLGLGGLMPAFVSSQGSPALLAVGLGGCLLAYRAFQKLGMSVIHITSAVIAWQQVAPFLHEASGVEGNNSPELTLAFASAARDAVDGNAILEAHDVVFRYREHGNPILQGCSLRVNRGDRLLLEGASGSGKSTLASLLTGLHTPESGMLLLRGLDQQTLGPQVWRQRIAAAPQFHENYVLTGTLAFNLLMGRRWPPRPKDLAEAETVCRDLGLGNLIDRMPTGLLQMVGETGWQLSHGELSRLYIARTLLQNADMIILDESFAALDPESLRLALDCVLNRTSTLLAISHP